MKQVIWIISCYLYGAAVILLVILLLLVYLRGQVNHLPNPFAKKNLAYRQPAQARGILFGKKLSLLAYSPEQDEGHIVSNNLGGGCGTYRYLRCGLCLPLNNGFGGKLAYVF